MGNLSVNFDGTVVAFDSTMEEDANSIGFQNIFVAVCPAAAGALAGANIPSLSTYTLLALAMALALAAMTRIHP